MDSPKTVVPFAIAILIGIGGGFVPTLLSTSDHLARAPLTVPSTQTVLASQPEPAMVEVSAHSDESGLAREPVEAGLPDANSDPNLHTAPHDMQPVEVAGLLTTAAGLPAGGHDIMLRSSAHNKRYVTTSLPGGEFVLKEVLPGDDYRLDVTPTAMLRRYFREPLRIALDTGSLHIALDTLDVSTLAGAVVNQNGMAVPGFRIKLRSKSRARWERDVTSDSAGRFELVEVPVGEIVISSLLNRVLLADGHHITGGGKQTLKLVVDAGDQEVGGLVFDQYNEPIPGATIMLTWEETTGKARSTGYHRTFSDPDGRFSLKNIGPGEHELIVASSSGAATRQTVDIRSGYTDLTTVLEQEWLDN